MSRTERLLGLISISVLLGGVSLAQESRKQEKKQTVAPAAASSPVTGSGAAGQITKWARDPQLMQRLKQQRAEAEAKLKKQE